MASRFSFAFMPTPLKRRLLNSFLLYFQLGPILVSFGILFTHSLAYPFSEKEFKCLGGTIQAEAENQPELGQFAVGCVVLNRHRAGTWIRPGTENTLCNITRKGQFVRITPNPDFLQMARQLTEQKCRDKGLEKLIGFFNGTNPPEKNVERMCPAPGSTKLIGSHTFYSKTVACPRKSQDKKKKQRALKKETQTKANSAHSKRSAIKIETKHSAGEPKVKKKPLRTLIHKPEGDGNTNSGNR